MRKIKNRKGTAAENPPAMPHTTTTTTGNYPDI
jgi:hypothetical protein